MNNCLVCRQAPTERLLDLGRQPISSHYTTSLDATIVEHPLALSLCPSCGVVQLAQPFPSRDLVPPYEWMTYREPETHLDAVVERVCRLPGLKENAAIAGITFKDATTLDRMRARGFSRIWSLDLREDLGATNPNANIESVQALLTPEKAAEIVRQRGPVDLLIARHIIEHAEEPRRLMQALTTILAPDGYLLIEVPECTGSLQREDFSMIWEEHTLYFTPETVPQILASAGCANVGLEVHPFPFEDVIVLYAQKSNTEASHPPMPSPAIARNSEIARRYAASFDGWTQRYHRVLAELTKDGRRVAAYGAGHLTSAFLNFHNLSEYFAFVVDDTPHKQGLFLPKPRLPIVPRERLSAKDVSACFFGLAPQLEDKIIANNAGYVSDGGRFYSMLIDSPRSIRTLCDPPA